MDIKSIFADRLKKARSKAEMTQAELAEYCGIKQSTISAYENGNSTPDLEVAAMFAEKLDVSLDWLCGFDGKTQETTPLQWLCYTENLISTPPTIQHIAIVRFQNSGQQIDDEPIATLSFYGEKMREFFTAYAAIKGTKEQVGAEVYNSLINILFEKYSVFFTPGFKQYSVGAPTATPPTWMR